MPLFMVKLTCEFAGGHVNGSSEKVPAENLAKALHFKKRNLYASMSGHNTVGPGMAFRVARLVQVGIDDLLAGKYPAPGTCPHCGRGPA